MAVSQARIQRKSKIHLERGPAWHRATTRKTILGTAREMIEQDGLEKTTLLRIAEKAGFAPPTVYAYFVRKADLVSAIVADDLSSFARSITEGFPFSEVPEMPEVLEEVPEEQPASPETAEAASQEHDATVASEAAAEEEPVCEPAGEAYALAPDAEQMTIDPTVIDTAPAPLLEQLAVTPPANNDESFLSTIETRIAQLEARRVDPWLERRLREFERMLAALDERTGAASDASATAGVASDDRLQNVVERLEAFEKRNAETIEEHAKTLQENIEAREAKLRQSHAELRTLSLETSGRLEVLERDRELRALAVEMPAVEVAPRALEPAASETSAAELVSHEEPAESTSNADESYLAAARRAALTAQSLARAEEKDEGSAWARTRLLVLACAGLGVVLLGSGYLLNRHATAPAGSAPIVQSAKLIAPTVKAPHWADFGSVYSAALAGNGRAQLDVGLVYLDGDGVPQDDARAGHWLEASAMSGDAVAQYWLATLFEHGKGEAASPAEAIRFYEASALQGNLKAMYKLAVSYAEGWGTHRNYSEAARWFSRAAELGFVNAQFNLGVLYERGFGVPQSLLDAYKWYALAAAQGDKDSTARIDALSSQLSAEDLASAREAVTAFKAQPLSTEANAMPVLPSAKQAIQTAARTPKS